MTAEDCNLEILRLSEKDPPTSSTLAIPQKRHSRSTVTGGYDSMDVVEVNDIIATPVNLLLATHLRFETEKEVDQLSADYFHNNFSQRNFF